MRQHVFHMGILGREPGFSCGFPLWQALLLSCVCLTQIHGESGGAGMRGARVGFSSEAVAAVCH